MVSKDNPQKLWILDFSRVIFSKTFPKCEQKTGHNCTTVKVIKLHTACLYN
jgi:hypothetical protein